MCIKYMLSHAVLVIALLESISQAIEYFSDIYNSYLPA